jgi:hypothetical protein
MARRTAPNTPNNAGGSAMTSVNQFNRRQIIRAIMATAPLIALSGNRAQAAKLPQKAVRYQDGPKDGKRCDGCNLFVAPNACKSVDGAIAPAGWCSLWVKKA